jgi:hypothetical protein
MTMPKRDFIIRQDSHPAKIFHSDRQWITSYMGRLQSRFPHHRWSVSERFPLNGSD